MVVFCCHMLSKCSEKQIMQRHAARPFLPTGCGPDNPKLTVACLASNSKRTLERSVRNAESILNSANEIGNVTKLVALVSNIHDAAHRGAIERLDAEVVVDASEVAILRFARGASELSDVSAESIEDAIRTVGVPPPIKAADGFALPSEWKTHADQSRALSKFFEDLWAQTRKDAEREKTTADPSEAVGLVQLGMYLKFASMATRTGDAALVSEAGARELLPRTFGFGEELVGVLSTFMDQRSVDSTWKLTERGKRAAAEAREAMDALFDLVDEQRRLISNAKLAVKVGDGDTGAVFVHAGIRGAGARLLARNPSHARASDGLFYTEFAPKSSTLDELRLRALAEASGESEGADSAIGWFAALVSGYLAVDDDVADSTAGDALAELGDTVVSTWPQRAQALTTSELVVRETAILSRKRVASIALQDSNSSGCVTLTFCASLAARLASEPYRPPAAFDLAKAQEEVESVATALKSQGTLASYTGTIGGVVEHEGVDYRTLMWKRDGDNFDSHLSFVRKSYIDLAFADYATRDRRLRTDYVETSEANGPTLPLVSSQSVLVLPSRWAIAAEGLVYQLKERPAQLSSDAPTVERLLDTPAGKWASEGDLVAVSTATAINDWLVGLEVKWSLHMGPNETPTHLLVSANQEHERVAY